MRPVGCGLHKEERTEASRMGFTVEEVLMLRRLRCAVADLKAEIGHADNQSAANLHMCRTWLVDIDKLLVHPPFSVNVSYPGLYSALSRDLDNKHEACCSGSAATAARTGTSRYVLCEKWDAAAGLCLEIQAAIQHEV